MIPDFEEFPKITRHSGEGMTITEKIDGTNAQIVITEEGEIQAGSRNRYIFPGNDNYGFAAWVDANKNELIPGLGPGRHFGEWWGSGIGRKYGLINGDKRFSLFNVRRWDQTLNPGSPLPPSIVSVVPILYSGAYDVAAIETELQLLRVTGSIAAPGFMDPEGIVIYLPKSKTYFKKYLKNDLIPKGAQ